MFDRSITMVGFHTIIAKHESMGAMSRLIEEALAPMGFNTLILEARVKFRCFPKYSTGTVTYEDLSALADLCEAKGIRLVPLFPCLGHQSNIPRANPYPLFHDHPEFLEQQNIPMETGWPEFAMHAWCASNDGAYDYIFPMIDEMAEACRAEAFHVGLDEVFDIGLCEKCKDAPVDALFARTVKKLHDHLQEKGLDMMMWGDRLLDCQKMGYSMWEGDRFGMYPALDRKDEVTRDIILCDWHYEWHSAGYPSVETLLREGFFTVPSFWRNAENAKHFWLHALEAIYLGKRYGWPGKVGGLLCTNWRGLDDEYVEMLLAGIRGERPEWEAETGWGVGDVIAQVVPKGKFLTK